MKLTTLSPRAQEIILWVAIWCAICRAITMLVLYGPMPLGQFFRWFLI